MKKWVKGLLAGVALAGSLGSGANAAELIANGGFEQPIISTVPFIGNEGDGSTFVFPFATVGGWSFNADAGLVAGVSLTFNGHFPPSGFDGNQYAILGGGFPTVLSQTFTSAAGAAAISWLEGSRHDFGAFDGAQTYFVKIDGNVLSTFTTPSDLNFRRESLETSLTAGSHTLSFVGGTDTGDHTAYLDDVSIAGSAAPEPGVWATILMGLLGIGCVLRGARRKQASSTLVA